MAFAIDFVLDWYGLQHGLAVFPCRQKRPLLPGNGGFKHATRDPRQLREWWSRWPNAQIGVPCGSVNHLLVVDIDGPRGEDWYRKQSWPETFCVETRPGRYQYWFTQPDKVTTKPTAGVIAPEVDIRGDGSYCIGPFSIHHETGKMYRPLTLKEWVRAPPALLALVAKNGNDQPPGLGGDMVPQGRRHQTMLSLAGSMRARGLSESAILTALLAANQTCQPPLAEGELRKLAGYVGGKPLGFRGDRKFETSAKVLVGSYADVKAEKICWLWQGKIARGKLNLFVGDPGRGKSLATIDIAARVSTGTIFPDSTPCAHGDVLILSAEDNPQDTVRPRLDAAGADASRVHRVEAVQVTLPDGETGESLFSLERDLQVLEDALQKIPNIALVIIDPLSAYMGHRIDTHVDAAVRGVLAPLAELAAKRNIAIIAVMHLRKSDTTALLRVSGSIGFVAAARIVWGFGLDPNNPDRHIMVPIKNNLAPLGNALAYRIAALTGTDVPSVQWLSGKVALTPDEVLDNNPRRTHGQAQPDAERWLQGLLADGPMPQQQIESRAGAQGFSWATIRRAKDAVGIRSKKSAMGGGWIWELPAKDGQGAQTCS